VIFIVVGPLFVRFRRDASVDSGNKGAELFLSGNEMFPTCPSDPDSVTHIQVQLDVTQLLAAQASMRVVADFDAFGDLVASREASTLELYDNETLAIWFGKTKTTYKWGDVLGKQEFTLLLSYSGGYKSYNFYPMDEYIAECSCTAYIETAHKNGSVSVAPVPICARFTNHLSTFDYKHSDAYAAYLPSGAVPGEVSFVVAYLKFSRTAATKFFSIFIVILMWALSASQLVLCIDHLFLRPREPLAPTVGFSIGLLFALPAVRNTQPEVPPIGVTVDVLGFFWNMSITALSACMFMAAFAGYHKYKPLAT
jgi:hypothetical protein